MNYANLFTAVCLKNVRFVHKKTDSKKRSFKTKLIQL